MSANQGKNYNQVRIDPDLYPTITQMAIKDDRSITKQVNRLLRQALGGLQPLVPPATVEQAGKVIPFDGPVGGEGYHKAIKAAKLDPPKPAKKIASEPSAQSKDFAPLALDDVAPSDGGASNAGQPEMACCTNPNPCKHWSWVGENQVWKNTLSGREKSNE